MKNWKSVNLKELFNEEQLEDILLLINHNDWAYLRTYLNKLKEQLEKKGILPDYLYYCLEAKFKK